MPSMNANLRDRARRTLPLALLLAAAAGATACDLSHVELAGRASDTWTRSYTLAPGGELEIINTNGKIDLQGADVEQIEIRAERVAKAATDAAARDLLPKIEILEDAKPDHVRIETGSIKGI